MEECSKWRSSSGKGFREDLLVVNGMKGWTLEAVHSDNDQIVRTLIAGLSRIAWGAGGRVFEHSEVVAAIMRVLSGRQSQARERGWEIARGRRL